LSSASNNGRRRALSPLTTLFAATSIITAALKRLRANLGLALCALIAMIAAAALAVCVPVYAEAASLRLLRDEIARQEQRAGRSPFALLFRYVGAWNGPLEWDRVAPADAYLRGDGIDSLQLPVSTFARHARAEQLRLFGAGGDIGSEFLKNVSLGFITGVDPQIRIVDGAFPAPQRSEASAASPIDVMISREFAEELGLNIGDRLTIVAAGNRPASIQIAVSGIWAPINPADPAWFFAPGALRDVLLVAEESYTGPVAAALTNEVGQVLWFVRLSGDGLSAAEAAPLLGRIEVARAQAAGFVPGLRLEQSPAEALALYRSEATALTLQLFIFSVPILALVLYFVALVAGLLVGRQQGEIALLKSRGVRDAQIVGIYIVEWVILGAIALITGPQLGLLFAQVMGRTRSFLQLAAEASPLPLALTWESHRYAIIAVAATIVAGLIPVLRATRRTLADEQRQAARVLRPPFWQRAFLDFIFLLPPIYGIYQLRNSGGLQLGSGGGADPLTNPLLILVPVLLCFALGLIAVRIIPMLLELLARLATRPDWIVPLVALRTLARQPGAYRGPLLLLILTLSLAAFTASMAATMDDALRRAIGYQIGASTQLIETGASTEQQSGGGQDQPQPPPRNDISEEPRFLFIPVQEHLDVAGIEAATRVGAYEAITQLGGANRTVQLVGVDRSDLPQVIERFDRAWGGGESLGALMNLLARYPDGAIVSRNMLSRGVAVGDALPMQLQLYGDQRQVTFRIIAAIDLWPGYYPQDGPIVVTNLNYIFDSMGGQYPYDVWIKRDPAADIDTIATEVRRLGFTLVDVRDATTLVAREQERPRRQGLFGLLSVGFVAAGLLTLLGFLLTGLITARRRAIEMGMLRALGLDGARVVLTLTIEQVILVAAGIGAGTGIGALAALLVVPLLQVGVGPHPGTPAVPPRLAWDEIQLIYIVFAAALLITLSALIWVIGRLKIFQAVKLGDVN
jgi:putative ABC transport system permease protein